MPGIVPYALAGGVAGGVTLVTTPIVRRVAIWRGWVVPPDERRVHVKPTPAIGGVAMFLGLLAGVATAYRSDSLRPAFRSSEMVGVLIAMTIIFVVGLVDDLHPISPPAKVAGLVAAGIVLSLAPARLSSRCPRFHPCAMPRLLWCLPLPSRLPVAPVSIGSTRLIATAR